MSSAPLSAAQLDDYRRDGYLVVADLLTIEEVDGFVGYEAGHDSAAPRGLQNHRVDSQWAAIAHNRHIAAIVGVDDEEILRLTVPAGSGVFFTGMTVHGSFANRSADRPRRAFATHFVGEKTWIYRRDLQDSVPVEEH